MKITEAIAAAAAQSHLSEGDACDVMEGIMNGQATDAQIAGLITAMRVKGETEEEITGFARGYQIWGGKGESEQQRYNRYLWNWR